MHAFMALFFYELIRDQIVFIWHAWAVAVVHGSPLLSAGPCLQYFWWPWRGEKKTRKKEKKNSSRVQVMSRTDFKRLFIHFCLCIYLFVPFDSRSELYGRLKCYFVLPLKQKKKTNWFDTFRDQCYMSTLQKLQSYKSLMNICTHLTQTLLCFDFSTFFLAFEAKFRNCKPLISLERFRIAPSQWKLCLEVNISCC